MKKLLELLDGLDINSDQIINDINTKINEKKFVSICDVGENFKAITTDECMSKIISDKEKKRRLDIIMKDVEKLVSANSTLKTNPKDPKIKLSNHDCSLECKSKIDKLVNEQIEKFKDIEKLADSIPFELMRFIFYTNYLNYIGLSYKNYLLNYEINNINRFNQKINISYKSSTNPIVNKLSIFINNIFEKIKNHNSFINDDIEESSINSEINKITDHFYKYAENLSDIKKIQQGSNKFDLYYDSTNIRKLENGILKLFFDSVDVEKIPDDIKKSPDFLDFLNNSYANALILNIDIPNNIGKFSKMISKSYIDGDIKQDINKLIDRLIYDINDSFNNIKKFYDSGDISSNLLEINGKIKSMSCCGSPLTKEDINIDQLVQAQPDNTFEDRKTYSKSGNPDMLTLTYWQKYSIFLNLVGLMPNYWTKGIIIPTPGGPQYLPCPIIWIPVFVINTPVNMMVLFITVNGMLPFPVLFELRFKPLADAESILLTAFRGGNLSIKSKTGSRPINYPIVKDIDINPDLSKSLPYEKDDIPIIERLSITNATWLIFLNKWLSTICPKMGFQP